MKTIEEAAQEYANNSWEESVVAEWDSNDLKRIGENDFKAGVQFAKRWIPVAEELPEADDHSLDIEMKTDIGIVLTGYRFSDGDWLQYDEDGLGKQITREITHWRPINLK